MPKTATAKKIELLIPDAPIAAGPSGPTMIVSTMPMLIQPISARMTGPASLSIGKSSRRIRFSVDWASARPFSRRLTKRPIDLRKDVVVHLEQLRLVKHDVAVVNRQCAEKSGRVLTHRWQQVHRLQNAARQFGITLLNRVDARELEGQRRIDIGQRLRHQGEVPRGALERRRLYSTDRHIVS